MSDSVSILGQEINGLTDMTRELNTTLTDIREDALDGLNFGPRRISYYGFGTFNVLRVILEWLGLPPFWALLFLVMSLPRFAAERIAKIFLWILASCFTWVIVRP